MKSKTPPSLQGGHGPRTNSFRAAEAHDGKPTADQPLTFLWGNSANIGAETRRNVVSITPMKLCEIIVTPIGIDKRKIFQISLYTASIACSSSWACSWTVVGVVLVLVVMQVPMLAHPLSSSWLVPGFLDLFHAAKFCALSSRLGFCRLMSKSSHVARSEHLFAFRDPVISYESLTDQARLCMATVTQRHHPSADL